MTTQLAQSKSALLVENDLAWNVALSTTLLQAGYNVTRGSNYQEAFELTRQRSFDVHVIRSDTPISPDVRGSGRASLEFYHILRRGDNIPYIVISKGEDSELENRCNEGGVVFMNLGTGYTPDVDKGMGLVNYVRSLK